MTEILTLFPSFLLCLVRLSCFFLTAPIFSYRNMPSQYKIGLSCILAYLATVTLNDTTLVINGAFLLLVLKEALVGLSMGFVAGLFFYAVQMAGTFIDLQMGLSMASVINPESGMQTALTGQLLYVFMMLFLFTVDAHHMLINGVLDSFQAIPLNQLSLGAAPGDLAHYITQVFLSSFAAALQMALPIVGSLFLVDVAVGIVARTVPQLNVFVVGLPLKIGVGFLLLLIVIPLYITFFRYLFDQTTTLFQTFQSLLRG
jgi:flagellar biosynthesis protein FliR